MHASHLPGAGYAYFCVLVGVFVTAFYSFRLIFLTFHGEERMDAHTREHLHESPWVVTVPLVLLAIPSVVIGWLTIKPLLFGGYFGGAIQVAEQHDVLGELGEEFHGPAQFVLHALTRPGGLAGGGRRRARPGSCTSSGRTSPRMLRERQACPYTLLENKYYFDWFNENVIAAGSRWLGTALWGAATWA